MTEIIDRESFQLSEDFHRSVSQTGLGLGKLEAQYQQVFAEALEDGVITGEERTRLRKVAANLGLDPGRLDRLEEAMTTAYETHHRGRVIDQSKPQVSLSPLAPPPLAPPPLAGTDSNGSSPTFAELQALHAENQSLRQRIAALEQDLERAQAAVNVEVDLGDLEVSAALTLDPEDAWKRVRRDPLDADAVRVLYESYDAKGNVDGKVMAAQALAALGAARPDELALADRHRPTGLITPQDSFAEPLWKSCIFHPDEDEVTGALFSVVAPAILVGRYTALRRDGTLHQPAEGTRHDPSTSTVMAVRAVGWAAAVLGLPIPPVYADKESLSAYRHEPGVPPMTVLGRGALSGRTAPELAFMVGRHLTGYRGEHFVKTLFTATEDLEDLFLAALLIANPALPLGGVMKARVEPLARAVEPLLEPIQRDALRGHYLRFAEEGGRTNLQRWSHAVDKTSSRAGLCLCQDLRVALPLLEASEGAGGPLALDLLSYSTSPAFLRLRQSLGIAAQTE